MFKTGKIALMGEYSLVYKLVLSCWILFVSKIKFRSCQLIVPIHIYMFLTGQTARYCVSTIWECLGEFHVPIWWLNFRFSFQSEKQCPISTGIKCLLMHVSAIAFATAMPGVLCFSYSFDRDRSGTIDPRELHAAFTTFGYRLWVSYFLPFSVLRIILKYLTQLLHKIHLCRSSNIVED